LGRWRMAWETQPRSDDPNNPLSSSPGIRAWKRPHEFDEPVVEQRNPGLQRMHHRRVVQQRQQCRGRVSVPSRYMREAAGSAGPSAANESRSRLRYRITTWKTQGRPRV
jgi:hypothetical protein